MKTPVEKSDEYFPSEEEIHSNDSNYIKLNFPDYSHFLLSAKDAATITDCFTRAESCDINYSADSAVEIKASGVRVETQVISRREYRLIKIKSLLLNMSEQLKKGE